MTVTTTVRMEGFTSCASSVLVSEKDELRGGKGQKFLNGIDYILYAHDSSIISEYSYWQTEGRGWEQREDGRGWSVCVIQGCRRNLFVSSVYEVTEHKRDPRRSLNRVIWRRLSL